MRPRICLREADALALVDIGQWPRRADPELLGHVARCASCAEVIAVATALGELDEGEDSSVLPDARIVWQRAQWQARHDAVRRAARPVVAVQGIVALGIAALIVAALGWLATTGAIGDPVSLFMRATTAVSQSIGPAIVAIGDVVRIEIPTGVLLVVAGAVALGLTTVLIAIGLSMLADLQSERSPRRGER